MADIEQAVHSIIEAAATTAAARIYIQTLPPEVTLPALAYTRVSTPRTRSLTGFSKLARPRLQYIAWAATYAAAKALADEVFAAVDGYQNTIDGVEIQSAFVDNEISMYDPESKRYGVLVEILVAQTE